MAVLGAMLLDNDAALKAAQLLQPSDFYAEAHRRVFAAMLGLLERGQAIDPIVLGEELRRRNELAEVGGLEYVAVLTDLVPTAANVEFHCKLVRHKALLRKLIDVGTEMVREAYEAREEAPTLIDHAEHKVFELSFERGTKEFVRIKELMWDTLERIEARHHGDKMVHAVASGFKDLDGLTNGFQESDLIIVAARPSMGKTAFCLNVAAHAAIVESQPVGIFSLEMSQNQLVERMLAAESMVNLHRFRGGSKLQPEDFTKLGRYASQLGSAPMWIDDTPALRLLELRSKARRLKAEHDVRLFIVDYMQLIQGPERSESRQAEISFISRSLKALARELHTPMVVLSQLSRAPEQRGGARRPMLSDLRDSGAIEQDADVVIFIYRQEQYKGHIDEKDQIEAGVAEVIVAKHRNGPTGTVRLHFKAECARFFDFTTREPDEKGA